MTISKKLVVLATFSIMALISIVLSGWMVVHELEKTLRITNERSMAGLHLMHSVRSDQQQIALALFRQLNTKNPEDRESISKSIDGLLGALEKNFAAYEPTIRTVKGRELYEAERVVLNQYIAMVKQYLTIIRSSGQAYDMSGPMGAKRAELAKLLDEHLATILSTTKKEAAQAEAISYRNKIIVFVIAFAAIIATAWLSFSVIRSVRKSLQDIQSAFNAIETHLDFTVRAKINGNDEIAETSSALNRLLDKLLTSFSRLSEHATKIAESSNGVSTSADQVAQAATQQSDASSSIAAAIEELTVSISHIGGRAVEANELSTKSGDLAASGGNIIGQTVADINDISCTVNQTSVCIRAVESESEKISSIISVIRDVADQTNLLALNAAIEAARAGEQGRGFAVVADEVRKLAERTADATREISQMIDGMRAGAKEAAASMDTVVERVNDGVTHAQNANQAIEQINAASWQVVRLINEITDAIREQSSASNNIAMQVERITQMAEVSNNASGYSATEAHQLNILAAEMLKTVREYKI